MITAGQLNRRIEVRRRSIDANGIMAGFSEYASDLD